MGFFATREPGEPYAAEYERAGVKGELEEVERKLASGLMRWYRRLVAALVGEETKNVVRKACEAGDIFGRLDDEGLWSFFSQDLRDLVTGLLTGLGMIGGKAVGRKLEVEMDWDYLNPAVTAWAAENSARLVQDIVENVRGQIRQQVVTGLGEGKTIGQVREEIGALAEDGQAIFSRERALRIASTEVIRAYNQGAVEGYKESGVVRGVKWTSGDAGRCNRCGALDGKVVALGEVFYQDPKFGDGMPPRHPHCRCSISPVTLKDARESGDERLKNNYRSSIGELYDDDAYTVINGVTVKGSVRRHYLRRHGTEVDGKKAHIEDMARAEQLLEEMLSGNRVGVKVQPDKPGQILYTEWDKKRYLVAPITDLLNGYIKTLNLKYKTEVDKWPNY